jgi:hypothetical protein
MGATGCQETSTGDGCESRERRKYLDPGDTETGLSGCIFSAETRLPPTERSSSHHATWTQSTAYV